MHPSIYKYNLQQQLVQQHTNTSIKSIIYINNNNKIEFSKDSLQWHSFIQEIYCTSIHFLVNLIFQTNEKRVLQDNELCTLVRKNM